MLVQSMDMAMLKWLVAFIVIYTSLTMHASWKAARESREPAPGWPGSQANSSAQNLLSRSPDPVSGEQESHLLSPVGGTLASEATSAASALAPRNT